MHLQSTSSLPGDPNDVDLPRANTRLLYESKPSAEQQQQQQALLPSSANDENLEAILHHSDALERELQDVQEVSHLRSQQTTWQTAKHQLATENDALKNRLQRVNLQLVEERERCVFAVVAVFCCRQRMPRASCSRGPNCTARFNATSLPSRLAELQHLQSTHLEKTSHENEANKRPQALSKLRIATRGSSRRSARQPRTCARRLTNAWSVSKIWS